MRLATRYVFCPACSDVPNPDRTGILGRLGPDLKFWTGKKKLDRTGPGDLTGPDQTGPDQNITHFGNNSRIKTNLKSLLKFNQKRTKSIMCFTSFACRCFIYHLASPCPSHRILNCLMICSVNFAESLQ